MARASRVAVTSRVASTRAGGRGTRARASRTAARALNAPSDALAALRDARVRRATDGAETTVPALVGARETDVTVVTFLRSFG